MSPQFTALLSLDMRLQLRNGIYYAYAVVVAFYVVLLVYAGRWLPAWAAGLVIYSDPAVLGFFFLGALMLLEKTEGVRSALAATPVSASNYLWSKIATLSAITLAAVIVLGAFIHGPKNWPLLIAATLLVSVQFIGIGVPIALRFKSVTSYLIGSSGLLVPVVLPGFLALADPMPGWAILIPATSQLKLILISLGSGTATGPETFAMLTVATVAATGCVWWGVVRLEHEFGRR